MKPKTNNKFEKEKKPKIKVIDFYGGYFRNKYYEIVEIIKEDKNDPKKNKRIKKFLEFNPITEELEFIDEFKEEKQKDLLEYER